jgi:peptidoglycan/LPS O-acetylase OafA/YrhL
LIPPRERLAPLTALRFFAALRIALYHFVHWERTPWWIHGLMATPIGVTFFFVCSGFVLTFVYEPQFETGIFSARRFYLARCARLLPVYAAGLILALPLLIPGPVIWWKSVPVLTLTQAWLPQAAAYWNPPAWALSAECFFFLVFPVLLRWLRRYSRAQLLGIATAAWCVSLLVGLSYAMVNPNYRVADYGIWANNPWGLNLIKFNPLLRLPEFVIGVTAGHFYLKSGGFPKYGARVFVVCVPVLLALLELGMRLPYTVVNTGLFAPLLAIAICGLTNPGLPARLLSWKPLLLLGNASYCVYMFHVPVCWWVRRLVPNLVDRHLGNLITMALIVAFSLIGYLYFEKPMGVRLKAFFLREEPSRLGATVAAG